MPEEAVPYPERREEEELTSSRIVPPELAEEEIVVETRGLSFYYDDHQVLYDLWIKFPKNRITAIIGPSGCGKSTLIRCLNRMNDVIAGARIEGEVLVEGVNIYQPEVEVESLRRRVGMVFQKPNPFPMSIWENVSFGPRISGIRDRKKLDQIVEWALRQAHLWDEVKDRLDDNAMELSGGQQQRLCIARCLANRPEIILFDEPASALDPISTARLEETILELAKDYTCIIVTHNMQEAARISDYTAFLYMGRLIEFNTTSQLFKKPREARTEAYITGRFG